MQSNSSKVRSWENYWRGIHDAKAYAAGGVRHPVVADFWARKLSNSLLARPDARILDIATGGGAILNFLSQLDNAYLKNVTCVDVAPAAIETIRKIYPDVTGIVADARSIPLAECSFDLVTSQFGIEYSGMDALEEAARLTAAGGSMIILIHVRSSPFFDECAAAVDAIERTQRSEFIPLALEMFEAGFAAVRGADRAPYDLAAKRLNPAIRSVESVLAEYGEHVAGDTVRTLYSGIERIHRRIQRYEPQEVFDGLRRLQQELPAFAERMRSMCQAAVDEPTYLQSRERLRERGFELAPDQQLSAEDGAPLAWVLCATLSH